MIALLLACSMTETIGYSGGQVFLSIEPDESAYDSRDWTFETVPPEGPADGWGRYGVGCGELAFTGYEEQLNPWHRAIYGESHHLQLHGGMPLDDAGTCSPFEASVYFEDDHPTYAEVHFHFEQETTGLLIEGSPGPHGGLDIDGEDMGRAELVFEAQIEDMDLSRLSAGVITLSWELEDAQLSRERF